MNINRLGRFVISDDLLKDETAHEKILSLMSNVIIVRAERRWDIRGIDYIGISDLFENVDDGCVTPKYKITFCDNGFIAEKALN